MTKSMNAQEAGRLGGIVSAKIWKEKKQSFITKYNQTPRICHECSKIIPYEKRQNKFCSRSCSGFFNNRRNHGTRVFKKCLQCNKKTLNKFCTKECGFAHKREQTYDRIRKGNYCQAHCGSRILKRFMIDAHGALCQRCGLQKWFDQMIPLNIHHKDGDATNNLPKNLELLCLNCHALTPNFGSKNKQSTRSYRYK